MYKRYILFLLLCVGADGAIAPIGSVNINVNTSGGNTQNYPINNAPNSLMGLDANGNPIDFPSPPAAGQFHFSVAVSVIAFGAVGDFVTDDSAAINRAVNYLSSIGGGSLYFPTPKVAYGIGANCIFTPSNIRFYGDGPSSIVRAQAGCTDNIFSNILFNHVFSAISNVEIDHLTIDGNEANVAYNTRLGGTSDDTYQSCVALYACTNSKVHDCNIINAVMDGCNQWGDINCHVENNTFTNIGKGGSPTGSYSWCAVVHSAKVIQSFTVHNFISGCLQTGIFLDIGDSTPADVASDLFCTGNYVTGCNTAAIEYTVLAASVQTNVPRAIIAHNICVANSGLGIAVSSFTSTCTITQTIVSNNICMGNGQGIYMGWASAVASLVPFPIVEGNICSGNTSGSGLNVSVSCQNPVITGNISRGNSVADVITPTGAADAFNSNGEDQPPTTLPNIGVLTPMPHYTVAGLPSASANAYTFAFVVDAVQTPITGLGIALTGGGGNTVPVFSNSTSWLGL